MTYKFFQQVVADLFELERVTERQQQDAYLRRFLEPLDVVDDDGNILGIEVRGMVHRLGLRHRTVFVMLLGHDGTLLLQRRGRGAGSSPLRLDIGVGGHVRSGEMDMKESAIREMVEELGLSPNRDAMRLVCEYNRTSPTGTDKPYERNRERRILFEYRMSDAEQIELASKFKSRFSNEEVSGYSWYSIDEVAGAVAEGRAADGLGPNFMYWLRNRIKE